MKKKSSDSLVKRGVSLLVVLVILLGGLLGLYFLGNWQQSYGYSIDNIRKTNVSNADMNTVSKIEQRYGNIPAFKELMKGKVWKTEEKFLEALNTATQGKLTLTEGYTILRLSKKGNSDHTPLARAFLDSNHPLNSAFKLATYACTMIVALCALAVLVLLLNVLGLGRDKERSLFNRFVKGIFSDSKTDSANSGQLLSGSSGRISSGFMSGVATVVTASVVIVGAGALSVASVPASSPPVPAGPSDPGKLELIDEIKGLRVSLEDNGKRLTLINSQLSQELPVKGKFIDSEVTGTLKSKVSPALESLQKDTSTLLTKMTLTLPKLEEAVRGIPEDINNDLKYQSDMTKDMASMVTKVAQMEGVMVKIADTRDKEFQHRKRLEGRSLGQRIIDFFNGVKNEDPSGATTDK